MSKKREEIEQEEEAIDREAMLDELFNDAGYTKKKEKKSKKNKNKMDVEPEITEETEPSEIINNDEEISGDQPEAIPTEESSYSGDEVSEDEDSDNDIADEETTDDSDTSSKKEKKEKKSKRKKQKKPEEINIVKDLVNLLFYIIAVVIICWAVLTFVGQRTEVSGDSMNDTLNDGDSLWIDKLAYRLGDPERYDIVVFPYSDDTYYIKRIIGLPGETVYIDEDGVIYINDEPLTDDVYGKEAIDPAKRGVASEPVTLGEDEYFVMGDNRNNSRDSRIEDVGNITLEQIEGKAIFRFSGGFGKIE